MKTTAISLEKSGRSPECVSLLCLGLLLGEMCISGLVAAETSQKIEQL
jgi:hypothetical protein